MTGLQYSELVIVLLSWRVKRPARRERSPECERRRAQAQRKTVLVIAHRLSTVKEADRIALVQDGRIAAEGRHEELAANNSYYEKIVSLQFAA
jgi:ABC-type transport system involved in Fe-S cluster assembly fused permease/ATPase subunit